jgi:hypothetical protein
MGRNYFIKHYKSSGGWGADVYNHKYWLMLGDKEPNSIHEYDPSGKTFRYCHVGELNENVFFDIHCHETSNPNKAHLNDNDRWKSFILDISKFLNSEKNLKNTKGYFYISEFCFGKDDAEKVSYEINLIRSDEERDNEVRNNSGGFIDKSEGDTHLFSIFCFSRKMKTDRKKLLQQICNACNQGIIEF